MSSLAQCSITRFLTSNKTNTFCTSESSSTVNGNVCSKVPQVPEERCGETADSVKFPFPFPPYDIQVAFMRELYRTLDEGKVGIFESPTGTGKSLSIICGALTWLKNYESHRRTQLLKSIEENEKTKEDKENVSDVDWFTSFIEEKRQSDSLMNLKAEYAKYEKLDKRIKDLKFKNKRKETICSNREIDDLLKEVKGLKQAVDSELCTDDHDDDFVVKDYLSDDEDGHCSSDADSDNENEVKDCITKIYYCSRTHSQLSQFINEIKKSPFNNEVRVVPLSSRQNSCINDSVLNLKSLTFINNRCIELQKNKSGKETKLSVDGKILKKKKSTGCPFYRQNAIEDFRDNILLNIQEIEDLASLGRKTKTCPYYSSRLAVPLAQLVVVPYNTLLHKSTREACGIDLSGNVVIIDEAHNLLDAISNIHSAQVTGKQLTGAFSQLSQYKERYSKRLKAKNLFYINQIIFILQTLLKYLKGTFTKEASEQSYNATTTLITLNQFVIQTEIDNLNLFKIIKYCKRSEITRKLFGFSEKYEPNVKQLKANGKTPVSLFLEKLAGGKPIEEPVAFSSRPRPNYSATALNLSKFDVFWDDVALKQLQFVILSKEPETRVISSPLQQIIEFFISLTNDNRNGRIVVNRLGSVETSSLKYFVLNPVTHFQDIVTQSRAVIVAGGTMQPIEEFSDQLFQAAGVTKERIVHFSCGHVISGSHLSALVLAQGPSGVELDYSYQNRSSVSLIDELGRIIMNLCNIVPGGLVCFFPSYEYQVEAIGHWKKSNMLTKIEIKKKIFTEPRSASQINQTLSEYSKCILRAKNDSDKNTRVSGAVLFSVVGGKMSEGINFSDDLGRCVIMVGMPYPNTKSPELKEKMDYLDMTLQKSADGRMPGQIYYENLCMKAVNQSIGRAIRHKQDFASILLLDKRYSRPTVQRALPGWIRSQLRTSSTFGPAFGTVRKFFKDRIPS